MQPAASPTSVPSSRPSGVSEQARIFVEESGGTWLISPAEDAAKDLEIAEDFVRMQNLP